MEIGVIGLPLSGKTTFLKCIAKINNAGIGEKNQSLQTTMKFKDERMEIIKKREEVIKSKLPVFNIFEPGGDILNNPYTLSQIKNADMLFILLRNFPFENKNPNPLKEFKQLDELMIANDIKTLKNRKASLTTAYKKTTFKKEKEEIEHSIDIIDKMILFLTDGNKLKDMEDIEKQKNIYSGLGLLSVLPSIVILSSSEATYKTEETKEVIETMKKKGIYAIELLPEWESNKSQLLTEEIKEFSVAFGLPIIPLYDELKEAFWLNSKRIVFYTIKKEDTRAWLIEKGETVKKAAGVIHTDIEKGFIRAEVINWADYLKANNLNQAQHFMKLEEKNYIVKDGDIINIRFKK